MPNAPPTRSAASAIPACAAPSKARSRRAERTPLELTLQLEDGPQPVRLDGPKLLHGAAAHDARGRGGADSRGRGRAPARRPSAAEACSPRTSRATTAACSSRTPSSSTASTTASNAARPGRRVDRAARAQAIEASGVYGLNARTSKSPAFCPVWRVPAAPAAERQPVKAADPDPAAERRLRLADAAGLGPRGGASTLPSSRHVVFRAQGHGVVVQDPCAARLRDAFIDEPDPKRGRCPAAPTRRPISPPPTSAARPATCREGDRNRMNRVLAHTGVKYPIVQAPMGWIARSQLASAVSNAGGLGIIETSSGEVDACLAEIARMKRAHRQAVRRQPADAVHPRAADRRPGGASGVKFVTTSAGSPAKLLPTLKAAGLIVYHVVPNLSSALKAVDAGVDGLVVEGGEGGGFKNPDDVSHAGAAAGGARADRRADHRRRRHLRRARHGGGLRAGRRGHPDGHALRQRRRKPGARQLQAGDRRCRRHRHGDAEPQVDALRAGAQDRARQGDRPRGRRSTARSSAA